MISAKLLTDYRKALTTVVETANNSMIAAFNEWAPKALTETALREELLEVAWGATSDLGNLASAAAADLYEKIRADQMPEGAYTAWLADLPTFDDVQEQAHMSARFLFDRKGTQGRVYAADPQMFLRELMVSVERMILDAARDTILDAARHDSRQPRVAVVAQPDACDFCRKAMFEGWSRPAHAAQSGGIFHDNCRCFTVPSWESAPEIEGVGALPVNRPRRL